LVGKPEGSAPFIRIFSQFHPPPILTTCLLKIRRNVTFPSISCLKLALSTNHPRQNCFVRSFGTLKVFKVIPVSKPQSRGPPLVACPQLQLLFISGGRMRIMMRTDAPHLLYRPPVLHRL
jgi:hypothetical protein